MSDIRLLKAEVRWRDENVEIAKNEDDIRRLPIPNPGLGFGA